MRAAATVAAGAGEGREPGIAGGEKRPLAQRELADGKTRQIVLAVDRVDGEALEQPLFDHFAPAALALLGGLENEGDRAGEIAMLGEIARLAEQHRGMAVVPASVHLPWNRRPVRAAGNLLDIDRIEIGA